MKALFVVGVVALGLAWSSPVLAQDPVKVDPSHYKVLHDGPTARVLKIDYAPGEKSPMHTHPDAIVVPLTASKVVFGMPDGKSVNQELAAETANYMPGGNHSPHNTGSTRVDAILVEFKGAAGKATLPAARPGLAMKVLAEGARGMAYRTTADPKFQEPAGTTHDYDQVVIAISATPMSLSLDGKPARTNWARGDVLFIPRGTPHESRNTAGKPVDFIIVAIK
jgi:quercetin dioxygenase-like cupin family protein